MRIAVKPSAAAREAFVLSSVRKKIRSVDDATRNLVWLARKRFGWTSGSS